MLSATCRRREGWLAGTPSWTGCKSPGPHPLGGKTWKRGFPGPRRPSGRDAGVTPSRVCDWLTRGASTLFTLGPSSHPPSAPTPPARKTGGPAGCGQAQWTCGSGCVVDVNSGGRGVWSLRTCSPFVTVTVTASWTHSWTWRCLLLRDRKRAGRLLSRVCDCPQSLRLTDSVQPPAP